MKLIKVINYSFMISDIKLYNNKPPELPVLSPFYCVQDVYKHRSPFHLIRKDLVQMCRAQFMIPGGIVV
jgi:hypothetical protein